MSDYIDSLYPVAVRNGISAVDFWGMTLAEINITIKAYNEEYKNKLQEKALFDYQQAFLLYQLIGVLFGSKNDIPTIFDFYPTIFDNKAKAEFEKARIKIETEKIKQTMMAYSDNFKKGVKKDGGNHN